MSGVPVPPYHSLGSPPVAPNNRSSSKRPAPRGSAAYPRKRANKACQVCRARRTKCDNKRPTCSFCEKTGAICNWSPDDLSSFDPASLAILERLDRLESLLVSSDIHPAQPILQGPISPESYSIPQSIPQTALSPESYIIPSYQHETREDRLGCVSIGLINVRFDAVLEWQPLKDQLTTFCPSAQMYEPLERSQSQAVTTPGELEMSSCNEMLACFWKSVHSKNPILVQEDIRRYMHQVCINGIGWDAKSCLVLLICALGTIASEFGSDKDNEDQQLANEQTTHRLARAEHYFAASQKRIGVCLGKRGLLEAQCFFYSGVYLATTMQPEAAWSLFLQATASCQEFRCLSRIVPRDEDRGPNIETEDKWVAEECTYWTCLKSELEIHLEISPPGFRTIDLWYPEKFPDPPRNITTDGDRSWFFYLAEIALRRLANRVMGYISQDYDLNNPREQRRAREAAVRFEGQAQDWIQSLPSPNELEQKSVDKDVLNFILKGHLANCHELIYWPFIKHALQSPQVTSDQNPNEDYIQKGLQLCVDRIELNLPGFRHRHHGTWGMVRACTRSAFVLLAASHYPPLQGLMPESWEQAVWSNVQLLEFWSREIKGARLWRETMIFLLPNSQPS